MYKYRTSTEGGTMGVFLYAPALQSRPLETDRRGTLLAIPPKVKPCVIPSSDATSLPRPWSSPGLPSPSHRHPPANARATKRPILAPLIPAPHLGLKQTTEIGWKRQKIDRRLVVCTE